MPGVGMLLVIVGAIFLTGAVAFYISRNVEHGEARFGPGGEHLATGYHGQVPTHRGAAFGAEFTGNRVAAVTGTGVGFGPAIEFADAVLVHHHRNTVIAAGPFPAGAALARRYPDRRIARIETYRAAGAAAFVFFHPKTLLSVF